MAAIDVGAAGSATDAVFRTCRYTGLKVDIQAQRLIKANAVAAVVFLAIGGLMGLGVAMTRWPAVHLLPAEWFYLVLTGHDAVPLRDRRTCGSALVEAGSWQLGHWPRFFRARSATSKVQKSSTLSEAGSPSSCPDTA